MAIPTAAPVLSTPSGERRGIQHLLHPHVLGTIVGGSGASAFVHVNRDLLPGEWPTYAVLAWAGALAFCAYVVLLRPRRLPDPGPPQPGAGRTYVLSVLGMLAMMALGMYLLTRMGRPELQPGVVVTAVGLHFIPFARAFNATVFALLGGSLAVIGVIGLLLGVLLGGVATAAAAVLTGVVMLALMGVDALRDGGPR